MPRPPVKRGRVVRQKAAAQPVQPTPLTKRRIDDVDDADDAQKATSANNATLDESQTREHETPRTTRAKGARGQQFASALRRAGSASSKIQKIGTPGFDSSMLSNFRPRPRQHSILHLMDDDDDDEENSSDFDSEAFLGSFDPEDESTPLNFNKGKTTLPLDSLPPSPSPVKKTVEQSQESQESPLSSAKRRKLIAVEVPATQPDEYPTITSDQFAAADAAAEDENEEHVQETDAELSLDDDDDDEIPLPEPLDRQMSPEIMSQTMVPPMSSSVAGSPVKSSKKPSQPTPSKNRRISTRQARVSTATLRDNLLPVRRRRRPQRRVGMEAFEVPSEEDEEEEEGDAGATDEDELSYLPSKGRKGSRRALRSNKQGANKKIERNTRSTEKKAKKDQITYSRRRSDKENDIDEDVSDGSGDIAEAETSLPLQGDELLKAKLKFAEVDRWEMDFEDVAVEQSSQYRLVCFAVQPRIRSSVYGSTPHSSTTSPSDPQPPQPLRLNSSLSMTRSHKYNDRDHAGLADGTAAPGEYIPRYFAKSGHVDADPKKTKKDGGGRGNWGRSGDEMHDYDEYTFANARRRSNSNTQGLDDFKTKFEMREAEPVFEEDLHGPIEGDKGQEDSDALRKTSSTDTSESVTTDEGREIKKA